MIGLSSRLGNHSRDDPFTHAIHRSRQILLDRSVGFIMFNLLRPRFHPLVDLPSRVKREVPLQGLRRG